MNLDEQADLKNAAQLERAIADSIALGKMLDGKGLDLEALAELPDTRPE